MKIAELVLSIIASMILYCGAILALIYAKTVIDDIGYIVLSVIFGFMASAVAVLAIKGLLPFIHGFCPPIWIIAAFCLLFTIPFIDRIEVFGNIIFDAVFCGILSAFIIFSSAAGVHELASGNIHIIWLKAWIISSLVISTITVSVIRIIYYV